MNRAVIAVAIAMSAGASAVHAQTNATEWDFNAGNLNATFGAAVMDYWDGPAGFPGQTAADTHFGSASSFGIAPINGVDVNVMMIPPYFGSEALIVHHGSLANGGGSYTNQYSLVFDVYITSTTFATGSGWFPFHNTNYQNANDADAYLQFNVGIGISGQYDGTFTPDAWHRVAFTFDGAAATGEPQMYKYIDGVLVGTQILDGLDGRWSLYCVNDPDTDVEDVFTLFSEPDGAYDAEAFIKSVYFIDRRLTTEEVAAMGATDADGIAGPPPPSCPCDFDQSGALNSADFFSFLTAFFTDSPTADFNHSGSVNSADFFDFLTCFFTSPAGCN